MPASRSSPSQSATVTISRFNGRTYMNGELNAIVSRIRDLINQPRCQQSPMRNRGGWLKLCSSLDVIGDCEMAMDAYCSKSMPSDPGVLYLATYGVLQALVVQQDAVRHLCECVA